MSKNAKSTLQWNCIWTRSNGIAKWKAIPRDLEVRVHLIRDMEESWSRKASPSSPVNGWKTTHPSLKASRKAALLKPAEKQHMAKKKPQAESGAVSQAEGFGNFLAAPVRRLQKKGRSFRETPRWGKSKETSVRLSPLHNRASRPARKTRKPKCARATPSNSIFCIQAPPTDLGSASPRRLKGKEVLV